LALNTLQMVKMFAVNGGLTAQILNNPVSCKKEAGDSDLWLVRGFPKTAKPEDVEEFFRAEYNIKRIRMPLQYKVRPSGKEPTGKTRGYCFLEFYTKEEAQTCLFKEDLTFEDQKLNAVLADRTEQTIKVERVRGHPTENELQSFFSEFGGIFDVSTKKNCIQFKTKSERQYRVGKDVKIEINGIEHKFLIMSVTGARTKDAQGNVQIIVQQPIKQKRELPLSNREKKKRRRFLEQSRKRREVPNLLLRNGFHPREPFHYPMPPPFRPPPPFLRGFHQHPHFNPSVRRPRRRPICPFGAIF